MAAGFRIVWVGRTQQRFVAEGVAHYLERLAPLQAVETVEVKAAGHSGRDAGEALRREGEAILKRVKEGDTVVLLDQRGRQPDTREFAALLGKLRERASGTAVLVVGGAYGVDGAVRRRADHVVALSRLTLPHQMVRVVLAEQLYRAFSLLAGQRYHHD